MEYEFNILYYVNMYKKWWKRIALVVIVSMFLTACFSLCTPIIYVSEVMLLSTGGGGASAGSLGKFLGLTGLSGGSSTEGITPLLNSRRMTVDIQNQFALNKNPKFRYSISIREIIGAFAIKVKGTDPVLTAKIANFVVQNLDKINMELNITPNKPMVKVLDPATYGSREPRGTSRKIIVGGMLAFLLINLYAFFSEYIKRLKLQMHN
ncbi:MAG TPA: hypothetical protein DCY56_04515 [Candidatus Omnitrophica bacterium]|nr:hypothetical protein [Candidatus Omnitrophota bacterium]